MNTWLWPVLLMLTGLMLGILELFFVSHGILTFLSLSAVVASIVTGFMYDTGLGVALLLVSVFGIPAFVILAVYLWPKTPVGRRVMLPAPDEDETMPDNPKLRELRGLIGRVGKTKGPMLPAGVVIIDGRAYDAVSNGFPIEANQWVRVVDVFGSWITVRALEKDEQPVDETPDDKSWKDRPITDVGTDPFAET
ncbi:MAG TPA: NfeD family protein [Thermogutta sp.]|nr:NfeD family protein [Thermogutta sp.]HPU07130.1 NfeD family protein [Thermogutta sp.]HPZ84482.1 NfeD family protein [Thermogutta sp.]